MNEQNTSQITVAKQSPESPAQWSRVSPIAIIYFFAKTLFFLINNVLFVLLPVVAFNFSAVKNNLPLFALGILVLLSIVLLSSCIKYFFYYYRLGDKRVEIRQGMLNKTHLDLPFAKIQNVKIIQPFYYRFSDYSIVELDTAGSAQQEANIVAIRLPQAESFKQRVLADTETIADNLADNVANNLTNNSVGEGQSAFSSTPPSLSETVLNRRSIKDLVIHGITNNRVWIFLGFLAPFYQVISENVGMVLLKLGFDINAYLSLENQSVLIVVLHLLSIVMVIMLAVVLFSVLGSIFIFYDYKLSRSKGRYIRRSGLLSKHEVSMQVSRIQRAVQQQDWLDVLIGRVNLRLEQNSAGPAAGNQAAQINTTNKLLVPSISPKEADELVNDVFAVERLSNVTFEHVSRRLIIRLILLPCLPIIALFSIIVYNPESILFSLSMILGLAALLSCIVVLRWYRWGFAKDDAYIYIRKGFFGKDYVVFPIAKTQQTTFTQTPFMRSKGVATLHVVLASGGMKVPYLKKSIVVSVIDASLLNIAKDKPAWM